MKESKNKTHRDFDLKENAQTEQFKCDTRFHNNFYCSSTIGNGYLFTTFYLLKKCICMCVCVCVCLRERERERIRERVCVCV